MTDKDSDAVPDGSKRHRIFLRGENVDLCVPSEQAIEDGWADWFNDAESTTWLQHGVFPNHLSDQQAFLEQIRARQRFAVMICDKGGSRLYGVISLLGIDWLSRSAQIALVVGNKPPARKLVALEAMALVTEHAFLRMGLDRVWAGQAFPGLKGWNERLEWLGYRTEGVLRHGFAKGRHVTSSVMISCLYDDYARLVALRDGKYWPGCESMLALIRSRPETGLASRLAKAIEAEHETYLDELLRIETAQRKTYTQSR